MEKQIEEMKKDIHTVLLHNCKYDFCEGVLIGFNEEGIARELCDEGYRKQSETAQEIFAEIHARLDNLMVVMNPHDGFITTFRKTMEKVTAEVDELKKKYTEADNARAD